MSISAPASWRLDISGPITEGRVLKTPLGFKVVQITNARSSICVGCSTGRSAGLVPPSRACADELSPMRGAGHRGRTLRIGRPIQPPMLLWRKPPNLHLERGFDRPVRRLKGDHARPGIGDTAGLADALDLRTLLREFASA